MNQILVYIQIGLTILILYPVGKLFLKYFKIFIWYMFNAPITWWNKEIEKPRLLFFFFGILFFIFSWFLFLKADDIWIFNWKIDAYYQMSLAVLLNIVGILILYGVWAKGFELRLLPYIKRKLIDEGVKSPFEKGYNLKNVLDQLIKLGYIECDLESFHNFLQLRELSDDKKIISFLDKRKLVRFIVVIFNINGETKGKVVEKIISYYFVDENNTKYNPGGIVGDLSKIRNEIRYEEINYTKIEKDILLIFKEQQYRK